MMGSQLMFYIYSNTVCIILEQYYCSQVGWVLLDKMRSREMLGQYDETVVPNVDCDFDPVATGTDSGSGCRPQNKLLGWGFCACTDRTST